MSKTNSVRALLGAMAVVCAAGQASALVSTNTSLNINTFLGADRFYNAGYIGTRAVVANVEAGLVWNGHDSLTHVNTFLYDSTDRGVAPGSPAGTPYQLGAFDAHATWCGQTIAGRGSADMSQGIAYGATLWSGSIATRWLGATAFRTGFSIDWGSFTTPYLAALRDGVDGRTADVFNGSWGFTNSHGIDSFTGTIDALIAHSGALGVFSAGNAGSTGPGSVGAPGTGFNVLTVGALADDGGSDPYSYRAGFSSFGPSDYYDWTTGLVIPGVRATVDIIAPGQNLTLALYGGLTGGNWGGTDPTSGAGNFYSTNMAGTSFSSPIVAGGASLLVDAAYDRFGGGAAKDARVLKAVLMNSADKLQGWDNGQHEVKGVVTTTQSLDYQFGTGRMNLDRAFDQFLLGTTDATESQRWVSVEPTGWDFGTVTSAASEDYRIEGLIPAGATLTATLTWFIDATFYDDFGPDYESFDDLDLQVLRVTGEDSTELIAESISLYNTSEHLHLTIPTEGQYMVRVLWAGEMYDFYDDANMEDFGLAWSVTIPAPGGFVLMVGVVTLGTRRRR